MNYTPLQRTASRIAVVLLGVCLAAPVTGQSLAGVARPAAAQVKGTAKGLFWKAERNGRTAWLVGSLHLLTPDFYPLPKAMEDAFAGSDVLMEEIDMNEASDPKLVAAVTAKAINPPGTTLSSLLSRETLAVVTPWLAKRGMSIEQLQVMKPWMVSLTVQQLSLQTLGFDPAFGIDKHFQDAATRSRKRMVPLETAIQQIDFLDSLSPGTQDVMLRESVKAADAEQSQITLLAAAWRAGDVAAMEKIALSDKEEAPEVYKILLVDRNRRWVPQVESCTQTNSSCFVVVGAAHLIGSDGLVALLQQRGYTVTQQ